MCGIAGFFGPSENCPLPLAKAMTDVIAHRGPDDADHWVDQEAHVGLGHRRLSILDLSPLGRQPMHSACGRFVIVYNGEVYNHGNLRAELSSLGYSFKGGSDTETILAAIAEWGLVEAVSRFVGMFAFALWDRRERELTLVRDRLGIKPLYYGFAKGMFCFGSELKCLRAVPDFSGEIDREALSLYFRHNYIPAPFSIYKDARKVLPGQIVRFKGGSVDSQTYWRVEDVWRQGEAAPFSGTDGQAVDQLDSLLGDAVRMRMLADVPLGAFLSGGIDSSTVVGMMQAASPKPIRTFSIGFGESDFDESVHAARIAKHLGTEHTELKVSPRDLLNVVPDLPRMWDEPFADSSQVPTLILSRMTRDHVTVSLSGDGGDELFSGYERYFWTQKVWNGMRRIPLPIRKAGAAAGKMLPNKAFNILGSMGQKVRWRLDALGLEDYEPLYRYFISHFKEPDGFVLGCREPESAFSKLPPMKDQWAWMSLHDLLGYLPEDILTKVDRASMAASLEARVPIIDHRVVEFAASLPTRMKVRNGKGKWLLRQVLYKYVPKELVERPKMGFGVPIEHWMRDELHEWCADLLNTDTIKRQGFIDADMVRKMWEAYRAGETNWHYYLWDVIMFQAWLEKWK